MIVSAKNYTNARMIQGDSTVFFDVRFFARLCRSSRSISFVRTRQARDAHQSRRAINCRQGLGDERATTCTVIPSVRSAFGFDTIVAPSVKPD